MEVVTIHNVINECWDGKYQQRDLSAVIGIMVHRIGVDLKTGTVLGYDAVSISNAFRGLDPKWPDVAKTTGGQNPYTVMIGGLCGHPENDGTVWQCLPLDEVGWHGRRFSQGFIGVALIGDFRVEPASYRQRCSLLAVLGMLCSGFNLDPYRAIKGHGEMAGAHDGSKAPGQPHACPGDLLDMNLVRDDTAQMIAKSRKMSLADRGFVLRVDNQP